MMKRLAVLALIIAGAAQASELAFPIERYQLDNGLMVLLIPDHSAPAITIQVWYRTGSKNERPGITGISHLFEHMMFKGTKKFPQDRFDRLVNGNGGINNAWTAFDNTTFYEAMPSDKLDIAVELEADRSRNLQINEQNLSSERNVVINERLWRFDNSPFGAVFEELYNNAFVAHPYRWLPIGFRTDIDAITLEDCLEYYRIHYSPNNSFLVIAGDFDSAEAMKLVKKYYGKIKAEKEPPPVTTVEPEQRGEKRIDCYKAAQLPILMAGYKIPAGNDPDIVPLHIAGKILFGGESSRLHHRLVYTEQKAIFIEGEAMVSEDPSLLYVMAQAVPGVDMTDIEKGIYEEIGKLQSEPISERELQKAKNQMEAEFIGGLESNEERASRVGSFEIDTGNYNNIYSYPDKIQAVTADDVMRVAKKYLTDRRRTVINLIPEQPAESAPAGATQSAG
jgi:predicted Zn-dependent peptidase